MTRLLLALALAAAALAPASASAALPLPEGDAKNVELVGSLPDATKAIAINFIRYEDGRDVMFVSTYLGIRTYDLADPASPRFLGEITHAEMKQPNDTSDSFFENEDMDVDPKRKLVFFTRDVTSNTTGNPGVFIIDVKDPAKPALVTFQPLPEGHTSTCVASCDFLWTAGLAARREIFATDITDPAAPMVWPVPIDAGPFDQPEGTSHDVSVDPEGVAWVSGQGYLRGYWTSGSHKDPITGQTLTATPTLPVLYGGGKIPAKGSEGGPSDLGRFVHNSERPLGPTASQGAPGADGKLIYWAEEDITTCDTAGEFGISSLEGALDTDATGDLKTIGTWSPLEKEGAGAGSCSAHWFTMRDHVVAEGFYANGTRFIDVSNPANPIQVAYFRPDDGVAWAAYWHGPYVYVADNARGVDILRVKLAGSSSTGLPEPRASVTAPCTGPVVGLGKRLRLTRSAVSLVGKAAGCGKPPARVQVALARVGAGRCAFLTAKRRLAKAGSCARPVWRPAQGTASWRFSTRARLPKGSYSVRVRALDAKGTPGPERSFRLDARKGGKAVAREEVIAPSKG